MMADCLYSLSNSTGSVFMALLCAAGLLQLLQNQYWPVVSQLINRSICVAAGFGDNVIKHVLTGFWYTDPYRVAAMLALCSIPWHIRDHPALETFKAIANRFVMGSKSYFSASLRSSIFVCPTSFAIEVSRKLPPYSTMTQT
ncbi:MAG: DUF6541 family protein [Collinsella sp.]